MEYKEFAKNLKELQAEKGLKTQIEFSRFIGVSKSFVSVLLLGEKLPSMDTALEICNKFDVNLDWLMLNKGHKRPGDEIADPLYKNIINLTVEQRQHVESLVSLLASQPASQPACEPSRAEPQRHSGIVPAKESKQTTQRLKEMATREQEAAGSYICDTERRAIERRVDAVMRTKSPMDWKDLRSSFTDRAPQDDEEQPRQRE